MARLGGDNEDVLKNPPHQFRPVLDGLHSMSAVDIVKVIAGMEPPSKLYVSDTAIHVVHDNGCTHGLLEDC